MAVGAGKGERNRRFIGAAAVESDLPVDRVVARDVGVDGDGIGLGPEAGAGAVIDGRLEGDRVASRCNIGGCSLDNQRGAVSACVPVQSVIIGIPIHVPVVGLDAADDADRPVVVLVDNSRCRQGDGVGGGQRERSAQSLEGDLGGCFVTVGVRSINLPPVRRVAVQERNGRHTARAGRIDGPGDGWRRGAGEIVGIGVIAGDPPDSVPVAVMQLETIVVAAGVGRVAPTEAGHHADAGRIGREVGGKGVQRRADRDGHGLRIRDRRCAVTIGDEQVIVIALRRNVAVEVGRVIELVGIAVEGARDNIGGDQHSRSGFSGKLDGDRQLDEALDLEVEAVAIGGDAVQAGRLLVLRTDGGLNIGGVGGQVEIHAGCRAGDGDRGHVVLIGVGYLSRSIDNAGYVLIENSKEEVTGAGGHVDRIGVRRRVGRGGYFGRVDLAGAAVVEAHIERAGRRNSRGNGNRAGDGVAGGRGDGHGGRRRGPGAGRRGRGATAQDSRRAEVVGAAAGDSGHDPGSAAGGREALAAHSRDKR